jgi:short subunit dehydrogenase-like uncharacterized protein
MRASMRNGSDSMSRSRVHDVVIYGATGFTGELVASYFAKHVSLDRTTWAIAGRNREKLVALRARLARIHPGCARLPLVIASTEDRGALSAMVKNARVVLTTVGPFARHGEPLFEACADHGTDYVDSTGEFAFVRSMRARHDQRARANGCIMVSCCGVDSIPTDLGLYFTMRQLRAAGISGPVAVEGLFEVRARASGGTWNSILSALGELREAPPNVDPPPVENRTVTRSAERVHRDPEFGWVVPFSTIDPEIALRSAAEFAWYGPAFSYAHYLVVRTLPRLVALGAAAASVTASAQLSLGRALLGRLLPSGRGPSEEQRKQHWFRLRFRARHDGGELVTEVRGGDPGYDETAKMLAQSALCLAVDRARLPSRAGVLTPACAFGDVLLARLQRAGLVFEVVSR